MNGSPDILSSIFRQPRLTPAFFATFIASLLLLIIGNLPEFWRTFFLPSLIVYALGAALIGTFHRQIGSYHNTKKILEWTEEIHANQNLSDQMKLIVLRNTGTETWIPKTRLRQICYAHLGWVASFIIYNVVMAFVYGGAVGLFCSACE